MTYSLNIGETKELIIYASQLFSAESIYVKTDQEYKVWCDEKQYWRDWYIKTDANGYFNPLGWLLGLRKKGINCFCLCGAYNKNDETAFKIGLTSIIRCENNEGELSFFANDVRKAYWNNSGEIKIFVNRIE